MWTRPTLYTEKQNDLSQYINETGRTGFFQTQTTVETLSSRDTSKVE